MKKEGKSVIMKKGEEKCYNEKRRKRREKLLE